MILQESNAILIRSLYVEQASIIAAAVCSLIVAGLLKGTIGVGLPVVALPLLSLFIDIKSAAMLLSMPRRLRPPSDRLLACLSTRRKTLANSVWGRSLYPTQRT